MTWQTAVLELTEDRILLGLAPDVVDEGVDLFCKGYVLVEKPDWRVRGITPTAFLKSIEQHFLVLTTQWLFVLGFSWIALSVVVFDVFEVRKLL